jgi:ABC-type lipoprotein release transport system permease subunit
MLDETDFFVFITLMTKMKEFEFFDLELRIKLNPGMVNTKDIPGTITRLNTLIERLTLKYREYWFYSPVTTQLLAAQLFVYIFLVITLIFLLPFFFLAFYISKLSSDLNLESRRIQYGVFLTRGINAQTIRRSYFAEGMILGVVNGVISFLLTPLFGLFLATYLPVELPQSPIFELYIRFYFDSIAQLGWSIIIGVFLGFFIMRIPYFYLRLSPHELMHQYRYEEAEITKTRGRTDIAILLLGLYPIGIVILLYLEVIFQAPSIFYIITLFLGSYALYVVPFSPFLISYGLSSIFTRQLRIISFITNVYSKLFPDLRGLADRIILSKLYRISRIAFVMSLSLTFIIFPLILSASFEKYNESFRDFTLGGDVRIDVNSNSNLTLEVLKNRPEVTSVSLTQIRQEDMLTLVYMNVTDYISSADIDSFWNLDQEALISLNESTILVSASIIKVLGLKLGDSLTINSTDFTIAGTFKALGGTDITIGIIHVVIINQQLDLKTGTGSFILKLNQLTPESIQTLYEYVKETDDKAQFRSKIEISDPDTNNDSFDIFVFIVRILETQAVLLSFVAIFALAFLMIIRVRERTREIGIWRSKGMSNKQLMQIMIVETASIGTLGIIIGLITGSILVIGFQGFIINTIIEGTTLIPLELIIPLGMWILLLLLILGTIILAIVIGLWATLTPVSQQIRYEDYM